MKISCRGIAVGVLQEVVDQQRSLNVVLKEAQQKLPDEQQAFLSELTYGSLRWLLQLQFLLGKLLHKPLKSKDRDVHFALILGLYQLSFLDKPAHAVINETVNLAREFKKDWASKLLNGVLRNFLRRQDELQKMAANRLEITTASPRWLVKMLQDAYPQMADELLETLNRRAPMSLRVNSRRYSREAYQRLLEQAGIACRPCPIAPLGLTLEQPVDVSRLPAFQQGSCSVQDESAQLAAELLAAAPNDRVLDACSAPGGKTAALLERTSDIQLIAVDLEEARQARTKENLQRLNLEAEVKVADVRQLAKWWDQQPFDRVLLDAPCSATGVIRRHPDIKHLRRADDISALSATQKSMLKRLWELLKPGGRLLYATCSILPQENTHIIADFLAEQADARPVPMTISGDIAVPVGLQLLPQPQGHDGFYYALLEKCFTG